jgi:tetratricopeptide (TPR) repeat protein
MIPLVHVTDICHLGVAQRRGGFTGDGGFTTAGAHCDTTDTEKHKIMTKRTLGRFGILAATLMGWAGQGSDASAQDSLAVRPFDRPAWVVGDVPDTVWILMESAVASDDEDAMKSMLREAEEHARAATVGQEDNVGRRFALAAVLGMRADREGGRTKVKAASALHDELQVVLALDPEHAQARYMMGRLHAGVRRMNGVTRWLATNLLGGATLKQASWEAAEEHLSFAESRAPEVPDHHVQLARVYRDTGRPDMAARELEHVLDMEPTSPMEFEARAEALEIQAELARN